MAKITLSGPGGGSFPAQAGTTLAAALSAGGHPIDLPCGGAGTCRRCRVQAWGLLDAPTKAEQDAFGPEQLADGWRLSCQATIEGDVEVRPAFDGGIARILPDEETAAPPVDPAYQKWGLAVDIGTTTMAARLYQKDGSGAAASAQNPQTRFGADVITRIGLALEGRGEELAAAVRGGVRQLVEALAAQAGIAPQDIDTAILTGNTAMLYLLCGQNPDALSHSPFEADRLFGEWLEPGALPGAGLEGARIYLPRCISAFVGGDITTAIVAAGLREKSGTALLADIGTNGELALWHEGRLLCCSTAAGPAFEGVGLASGVYAVEGAVDKVWLQQNLLRYTTIGKKPAVGVCGSGVIDTLAVMLAAGVVDETGAFDAEDSPLAGQVAQWHGQNALQIADGVVFTAADVRKVQLAKGSLRAGMETLLIEAGLSAPEADTLYIAGGFGNYLDLASAAAIGLIPPALEEKAKPIGNAALAGAGMLMQNRALMSQSEAWAKEADTVDLGPSPVFQEQYMEHMFFE